jgi:ectoine hydroxylase-related dioxygenase (phytanoyl-CoA dioxygenase family)
VLTDGQRKHYETFGYLVLRGFFDVATFTSLAAETESALRRSYGATIVDPNREQASLAMGRDTPMLAAALESSSLAGAARTLHGRDALGIATYVTSHVGDTGWHADSPHDFPRGVKFSAYVGPTRASSGALRVIPGSHRPEMHESLRAWLRDSARGVAEPDVPCVVCESEPGDLIAFNLRLFHAALGGGSDRRVINVFYYENPTSPADERRTREQVVEDFEWLFDKNRGDSRGSYAEWLANASGDATRAAWIRRFDEMGFFALDPEHTGRFAATELPIELRDRLATLVGGEWSIQRTSVKSELVRIVLQSPGGEIMVMVRPAADPRPRLKTLGPLAWGYGTLDKRAPREDRMRYLESFIDRAHAAVGDALLRIMQ